MDSVFLLYVQGDVCLFYHGIHHHGSPPVKGEYERICFIFVQPPKSRLKSPSVWYGCEWLPENSSRFFYVFMGPFTFGLSDAHCMKFGLQCVLVYQKKKDIERF